MQHISHQNEKKRQDKIQLDSIPDVTIKSLRQSIIILFYAKDRILNRNNLLYNEDLTDMFILRVYLELLLAPAEQVLMEKPSVKIHLSKHALLNHTTLLHTH